MNRRCLPPSVIRIVTPFAVVCSLASPGCSGETSDSQPLIGGDTCTALTDGTWTFSGEAFGMGTETMDGDVTMSVDDCAFTIDAWSMAMDDLPTGGVLDGDSVQLDGLTSKWRTCTGTASDENTASGTCDEDGTSWAMAVSVAVGG